MVIYLNRMNACVLSLVGGPLGTRLAAEALRNSRRRALARTLVKAISDPHGIGPSPSAARAANSARKERLAHH